MGALALVAAAVVGATVYDVGPTQVLSGFPGNLFVILVGVTYLFALAKNNGTVDWIVHAAVRAVGGRVALIPWAMFVVCAAITAIGAITPAAVAIVAPVALGFGKRFRIHPVLIGFLGCFGAALLISVIVFFAFGGRELLSRKESAEQELQTSEYLDQVAGSAARGATRSTVTGTPQSTVESTGRAGAHSGLGGGTGTTPASGSGSGRGTGEPTGGVKRAGTVVTTDQDDD